jgi:hypothetical protein
MTRFGEDTGMDNDWVDDDSLSRDETMERFRALGPVPTRGPLPGGAVIMTPPQSYGAGAITRSGGNPLRVVSAYSLGTTAQTVA